MRASSNSATVRMVPPVVIGSHAFTGHRSPCRYSDLGLLVKRLRQVSPRDTRVETALKRATANSYATYPA